MPMRTANRDESTEAVKVIKIRCKGAATASIDDLIPLQGSLKSLTKKNADKLRRTLLDDGFAFPFFVWKNSNKLFVLDGHQRDRVLRDLQKEGYKIPPLPIAFIDAENERDAKKKILLISSQYGRISESSLGDFLSDAEFNFGDIWQSVELPWINLSSFTAGEDDAKKAPVDVQRSFKVVVDCVDESDQRRLIEELEGENIHAAH